MIKKPRKLLALALAALMSMTMAIPAFAAEVTPDEVEPAVAEIVETNGDDAGIVPLSYTNQTTVRTNGTWVPIASDGNGFNCNAVISIPLLDGFSYKVDIGLSSSMLNVTPNTVISDAFGQNSNSRTVALGNNKALFIRISPRTALGGGASSYTVNTTVNK